MYLPIAYGLGRGSDCTIVPSESRVCTVVGTGFAQISDLLLLCFIHISYRSVYYIVRDIHFPDIIQKLFSTRAAHIHKASLVRLEYRPDHPVGLWFYAAQYNELALLSVSYS